MTFQIFPLTLNSICALASEIFSYFILSILKEITELYCNEFKMQWKINCNETIASNRKSN